MMMDGQKGGVMMVQRFAASGSPQKHSPKRLGVCMPVCVRSTRDDWKTQCWLLAWAQEKSKGLGQRQHARALPMRRLNSEKEYLKGAR